MKRGRWRPILVLLGLWGASGAKSPPGLAAAAPAAAHSRADVRMGLRGMEPGDVWRLRLVTAIEISPDGKEILYTVERADREANAFTHSLWLQPLDGGEPRQASRAGIDASAARFSADGRLLAFLASDAADKSQIFVQKTGRRRAKQVTRVSEGVEEFEWSPDGARFVFVRRDSAPVRTAAAKARGRGKEPDPHDPFVITRTQIQADGVGFLTNERDHLWVVSASGGEPARITSGPWDDSDPEWSPDGRWIAFVSNRTVDPDTNDNTDIYLVKPDGGDLHIVAANPGPDGFPRWSRCGDRIAFVGQLRANDFYQITRLMVARVDGAVPAEAGPDAGRTAANAPRPAPPLDLTGTLDAWVSADAINVSSSTFARVHWSPDDSTLFVPLDRRGANWLAAVPSSGGAPREILGGPFVLDQVRVTAAGDRIVFAKEDATHLPDIHVASIHGTGERRISRLNDEWTATTAVSIPRKLVARNAAGDLVESWLYPPLDLDESRRYPLILYIHGGPQGYDGDWFDTGLENQIFPAMGWAVLRVNYRGSTSYGEAFCRSVWADWHTREHEDLMASVDAALEIPWLDASRLGIGGWSYGGIMTVWAAGHTDRFKVGIPERFEVDYPSSFGEDQWFAQYLEELGSPLENAERYRALSPVSYAAKIRTPLYLIANAEDGNCPRTQAMQLYQRLKLLGVKTELVVYPREPHVMGEPRHLVDRLHRLIRWFTAHLGSTRSAPDL